MTSPGPPLMPAVPVQPGARGLPIRRADPDQMPEQGAGKAVGFCGAPEFAAGVLQCRFGPGMEKPAGRRRKRSMNSLFLLLRAVAALACGAARERASMRPARPGRGDLSCLGNAFVAKARSTSPTDMPTASRISALSTRSTRPATALRQLTPSSSTPSTGPPVTRLGN